MTLSRQSLEILLDLIEMKVNAFQIQDREDSRELIKLRKCRQELILDLNQLLPKRKTRGRVSEACARRQVYRKAASTKF